MDHEAIPTPSATITMMMVASALMSGLTPSRTLENITIGSVDAPLMAQVPIDLTASIPCRLVQDLPTSGGLLLRTAPPDGTGAPLNAMLVRVTESSVDVVNRNAVVASAPRDAVASGGCSAITIESDITGTTATFDGLTVDGQPVTGTITGDERPQIVGVFTEPFARGRGLARRGTAELARRLLADVPAVCLFVREDNAPAPNTTSSATPGSTSSAGEEQLTRAATKVAVLNGTTIPGLASREKDTLTEAGFSEIATGNNTDQQRADSSVLYGTRSGARAQARAVARQLNISTVQRLDADTTDLSEGAELARLEGSAHSRTPEVRPNVARSAQAGIGANLQQMARFRGRVLRTPDASLVGGRDERGGTLLAHREAAVMYEELANFVELERAEVAIKHRHG